MAAATTVICLLLGFPLALFISRAGSRKNIYLQLVILPFWTSFLVRIYAWLFLLRDTGLINTALQHLGLIHDPLPLLYNDGAVLLGLVYGYLPFMVLPVYATLERLDPALVEAAADLGAKPWPTLLHVILPLSAPGIRAGSILVFIPALGAYLTPDLLGGGRTVLIGNLVQNQFTNARDWPFGAAISVGLMALVGVLVLLMLRQRAGGAGMKRWLGLYAAAVYLFLHLPLVILAVFSFNSSRFTVWQGFSLHWYRAIFQDQQLAESAWNSVIIAVVGHRFFPPLPGTLCAYGLWKRGSTLLSGSLYLSLVTPEIVMGISLLALFQWSFRWLHWRLGLHTVILAHVAFSIAYVVIVIAARLRTFSPALEEAALDLGATEWQAFRYVTLPALLPGIVAAALLALTVSFDDYVITSMVAGVDSETLPMVIYAMARRGASPVINAISALIVVVFGALVLISERMREA